MGKKIMSLAPVLPNAPRVLILGSIPGALSLEKQEYYGNPRNHFWGILFALFNQESLASYQDKIAFVKDRRIALWDSIGTCYREGSLDANITEEVPNDIVRLVHDYPTIKLIACNGGKSYQTFNKNFALGDLGDVKVLKLPSTSPIPGRYTKTFDGKVEEWKQLLKYL
ncbi:DNA-deoxyinosine glycosylase [Virgibacillus sp. C22-A2]|uniref:DNA-deoxyinosine glycosylase n=1 Tax=Virgibacillus tibetensis TaxID=3042313 RepID=A0ABU6KF62_9BACI|nr:DNA-deoxyinosine glycosylase [Virgibacillus sp. C22-A2]